MCKAITDVSLGRLSALAHNMLSYLVLIHVHPVGWDRGARSSREEGASGLRVGSHTDHFLPWERE